MIFIIVLKRNKIFRDKFNEGSERLIKWKWWRKKLRIVKEGGKIFYVYGWFGFNIVKCFYFIEISL